MEKIIILKYTKNTIIKTENIIIHTLYNLYNV